MELRDVQRAALIAGSIAYVLGVGYFLLNIGNGGGGGGISFERLSHPLGLLTGGIAPFLFISALRYRVGLWRLRKEQKELPTPVWVKSTGIALLVILSVVAIIRGPMIIPLLLMGVWVYPSFFIQTLVEQTNTAPLEGVLNIVVTLTFFLWVTLEFVKEELLPKAFKTAAFTIVAVSVFGGLVACSFIG